MSVCGDAVLPIRESKNTENRQISYVVNNINRKSAFHLGFLKF